MASGVASSPSWTRAGLSPLIARRAKVMKVATRKTGTKIATDRATVARIRPAVRRILATPPRRRGVGGIAAGALFLLVVVVVVEVMVMPPGCGSVTCRW